MTPRDRLKNVDMAVLFLQKVLQANKIIAKNKEIIRPTYPNFKKHVTGNTHIFLFGLMQTEYNKTVLIRKLVQIKGQHCVFQVKKDLS